MNSHRPIFRKRFKVLTTTVAYLLPLFLLNQSLVQAATKYWDTSTSAGLGGTGTWASQNTNLFTTDITGSSALTSAATTDSIILQGTAGGILLSFGSSSTPAQAASITVNTTGYSLTPDTTARFLTAPISLANNVNLNLMDSGATANTTLNLNSNVGMVGGNTGGTITLQGASTFTSRVNLNTANTSISVPIIINDSGTGLVGIDATATGTSLGGTITNNSTATTMIGATSGNAIALNGKITGSSAVQFSAGANGGAGTVTLNAASDYQGTTLFALSAAGKVILGTDNGLSQVSDIAMGSQSGNGGILDLNGHDQTVKSLSSGAGGVGSITNGASGTGTNTLTINGSGSGTYTSYALAITDGATAKTALTRSGTGTTTLSGANTYTGPTQITGGTLTVSGSLGNTAVSLSNANSTLSSGVNTTSTIAGSLTANSGTFITPGGAGTVGTLTSGALTLNGGSTLNFDLLGTAGSNNYDKISTTGLTLGAGTETINIAGSGLAAGNYTLISGYNSLSATGAFALGTTPGNFTYSLATGAHSTILTVAGLGGSGNLTWSLGGLAPTTGTDGAGTWTNGAANFYNTGTSAAMTWDNTATNNLTVGSGGAGGTVTLGGNVRVGGTLTFAAVSSPYTIGASGGTNALTLAGGITVNNSTIINAPTVLETSQTWSVANAKALTANGSISETGGARSIFKDGAGTLTLAGTSNTYSGGTTINNGTLAIASGSSSGTGNVAINSGATLSGAGTVKGTTSITSGTINGSGLTLTGAATFGSTGNNLNGTVSSVGGTVLSGSSDLTVNGTLTVTGNTVGPVAPVAVTINGSNSTLTNLGTISQTGTVAAGTSGRAIFNSASTGVVINNGSATNSTTLIQTADGDVVRSNVGGVTLNNYGTLNSLNAAAGGSQAVDFNPITTGSNIINNFAGATMQASEADAVRPGVNGFVNNDGIILSTRNSSSSSDGIDAQANSGITIVNAASAGSGTGTGTIEGARHGITGGNTSVNASDIPNVNNGAYSMSITNNLGGTIKGNGGSGINIDGLNGNETVTIVNHGTITGNGQNLGDGVAHDGDGVDIDGVVNITNTGTIKSINAYGGAAVGGVQPIENSEGVTVGGGTIINSGLIQGSVAAGNTTAIGRGITIAGVDKQIHADGTDSPIPVQAPYAATTITNQTGGQIIGDSDSAIIFSSALASGFSHTINNQAGALIQTGSTTAAAILLAADNTTLNNAGTIDGHTSGYAITGDTGNITLNVTGGSASILGAITGGSGTNVMHLDPGAGNTFSYAGAISNFSSVEVKSGTVALSGASTGYSGTTTLTAGQLNINNAAAIGTGAFVINGGAIDNTSGSALALSTNNALSINSDFEFKGTNNLNLGTGNVTLNANHTVTVDAGTLTIGGGFTNSSYALTKAGAGTLLLNGASSFSGPVTVSSGALSTSNVASLGTGTQVNLGSGSALQYTGGTATITQDITVTSGTGTIQNTGGGTLTLSGTLNKNGTVLTLTGGVINANGAITGSSAGSDLVVDAATVNENSANTYNGPTYIRNAGTLNANVANALPTTNGRTSVILDDTGSGGSKLALGADQSAASLNGAASSTVDLSGHTLTVGSTSGSTTYNGVITSSSGGILVKDGGSTLVLAGASTYSGGTQINGGTLSVTNTTGSATGSGSVMVNAGGTLNGTGTVSSVSVASGGTLAPGLSVGSLNVNGTVDLVAGSHLDYNLGSLSSLLNISGALNYTGGGTAIFDIADTGSMSSGLDYTLINYASESGLTLANLAIGNTPPVFVGHFVIGANSLTLHVDSVPEPSRAVLGFLGLAFIALRRRRSARKVVAA